MTNGYFQFTVSTAGATATGVDVTYAQSGSNTGPRDFALYYSTTGASGPFTEVGTGYQVTTASFSTTSSNPATLHLFDLSAITALDNNANDVFRVVDLDTTSINGATVGTTGTDRIDDFTVTVPEPTTVLGGALAVVAFGWSLRRRLSSPPLGRV